MNLQLHVLGDYYQLLLNHRLLADSTPLAADLSRPVALVSCDSQEAAEGTLFLCKGAHFKPQYLIDAAARGAFCYVSETVYPEASIPCIRVTDVRRAMALMANFYYNDPWKKLNVVGITGTKGKSTTAYYVKYILDEYLRAAGKAESGIVSSITTYDGVERFPSRLTTPEPLELERHFANGVETGMDYLTMEVSSQALKYDRVLGVNFAVAAFLNIGSDHISPIEHPDLEDYFTSKLRIFDQCAVACVNLDSDQADRVLAAAAHAPRIITFSQANEGASVYGFDVKKSGNDILFRVRTPRFCRQFRLTMPGLFNVQNALAAIAICEGLGIPEQAIYVGLMKARVPGRMEVYTNANNRVIAIVDYAHNRLSFEKLFQSVQEEYPGRRIVTVFGCPGKKAFDRRRDLGEISGKYSDLVILTEEDSGEEPTEDICREISVHVAEQGCDYSIQPDRGEAIQSAVNSCEVDSILLITGKGAETRQKRGIQYIECPSDVEYVQRFLHDYDVAHHLDGMSQVLGLLETLPRLQACAGKVVVVKYGGSALGADGTVDSILEDVAALRMAGARVVLVHGGGRAITGWLDRLGVPARFLGGYRVTDDLTMQVAEMALSGQVNKEIVTALTRLKLPAVGVSGKDGGLLTAVKKECPEGDLGHVGQILRADGRLLTTLLDGGFVPVVSPIAMGTDGEGFNVNADDAACAVAAALRAEKLVFLTDVDGVLMDKSNEKTLIKQLSASQARELLESGLMAGGMVPKLNSCLAALDEGVRRVVILDGRVAHTILLEAVSNQIMGTVLVPDNEIME